MVNASQARTTKAVELPAAPDVKSQSPSNLGLSIRLHDEHLEYVANRSIRARESAAASAWSSSGRKQSRPGSQVIPHTRTIAGAEVREALQQAQPQTTQGTKSGEGPSSGRGCEAESLTFPRTSRGGSGGCD